MTEINVNEVAAMVKLPMTPVFKDQKAICDGASMMLKCGKNHMDSYAIQLIMNIKGKVACRTCNAGTKFSNMTREILENTFECAFILCRDVMNSRCTEYHAPPLKLRILCSRDYGEDRIYVIGDRMVIEIHPTGSVEKIHQTLYNLLQQQRHFFNRPELLDKLKKKPAAARVAAKYVKSSLPYSRDQVAGQIMVANKFGIQTSSLNLNIVANSLCLENCK